MAFVRTKIPLRGVARYYRALVQLGCPNFRFALRRLANGAMLSESGDPLGLHPVVIWPRLSRDRLQRFHGVETRETVLHRGRPEMIRQIPGAALCLDGLSIRGRAQTGRGRRGRVESPVRRILGILDVRAVKVAVA